MSGQGGLGDRGPVCFSDPGWRGLHVARDLPWLGPRELGLVEKGWMLQPCGRQFLQSIVHGWIFPSLSSIALDPLYPSRCSWETFGYATSTTMAQASDGLSPLQLSGQLNSLPCSLTFRQEETISIIRLIEQVGLMAPGGGPGPLPRR